MSAVSFAPPPTIQVARMFSFLNDPASLSGVSALLDLPETWEAVTIPFATKRWIAAALVTREPSQQAHVFCHRDRGQVQSLLPLFVAPGRHRGLPVRQATVLGDTWSAVELPGTAAGGVALADWLMSAESGNWHLATLGPIADTTRLVPLLARLDAIGARYELLPGESQHLTLAPSWEAFLEQRSRNFRRTVKRKAKTFAEAGLTVRHVSRPDIAELHRTVFAVSDRSWQGVAGVALAHHKPGRHLYEQLCGDGPDFSLELTSAWSGDTCVAYLLGVRHGDVYHALDTGFDSRWRDAAPGTVLHHEVLERLCNSGAREVNFGSAHEYKDRFDVETRPAPILRVYRSRSLYAIDALATRARRVLNRPRTPG